jgi:succinyl-CoA synthetase beta subunit
MHPTLEHCRDFSSSDGYAYGPHHFCLPSDRATPESDCLMNIHEYQAKELLAKFGVGIPEGHAALSDVQAVEAAKKLPGPLYVVKAQIHAGGRGKGKFKELGPDAKGGVRLSKSIEEVEANALEMLGNTLVTVQTGEAGKQVNRLYVTDGVDIAEEFYLSMLVDRATGRVAMIVSTEGGMDIETVAHETPEKIVTITIDPAQGFMPHHGRAVAFGLKLEGDLNKQAQKLAKQLYEAFTTLDCSMLEINPLVQTAPDSSGSGKLLVLDTKMSVDSNALYRHPDVELLRDETEEDPAEVEASKYDLAYIKLDGNIGCMVNGAGLAMATMDIIKLNGAFPANFLDVGGGASKEKVTAAFKIILSDPAVEGILVNIFGGIMRCDTIAEGIVEAAREVELDVPLVVRLEGTNVEQGKDILENSGLPIVSASDLGDAARKIVAEVKKAA